MANLTSNAIEETAESKANLVCLGSSRLLHGEILLNKTKSSILTTDATSLLPKYPTQGDSGSKV